MEFVMSKYISKVGGIDNAKEIVCYHKKYFKNYKFFDVSKKMFVKEKDQSRIEDFIFMNMLIGEVRKH